MQPLYLMLFQQNAESILQELNPPLKIDYVCQVLNCLADSISICCSFPVRRTTTESLESSIQLESEVSKDVVGSSFFYTKVLMSNFKVRNGSSIPLEKEEERQNRVEESSNIWESIEDSVVFNVNNVIGFQELQRDYQSCWRSAIIKFWVMAYSLHISFYEHCFFDIILKRKETFCLF